MVMSRSNMHAVPGHDDIAAHKQSEEQTIDCSNEVIAIIKQVFARCEKEATSVSCQ